MNKIQTLIAASLLIGAAMPAFPRGIEIPTDISEKGKPATIKVLLAKEKKKVLLEAKGSHSMYHPISKLLLTEGSFTKRQWICCSEQGLVWGELIPGNYQIRLVPNDSNSTILVDGIEYRGCVEIYDIKGEIFVVNEVDIERYLKSTMPAQFPSDLDDEVMDAIAIVARTNAYYIASKTAPAHWHVDASDVGYEGSALTLQIPQVDKAINNTRFMTMTYQGLPFPATWTKDSAGKTTDFSTLFRKDVNTPSGVQSAYASHHRPQSAWTLSLSKQELAKALGVSRVVEFDIYQDTKSQKVYGAKVKAEGKTLQFDFAQLQKALGSARLKSSDFQVQTTGDSLIFKGFGEGSGVGLCLFSASAMSDKGEKAPKILAAFFPETKLNIIRSFEEMESMLRN
jgi:stage II sporulation protein D